MTIAFKLWPSFGLMDAMSAIELMDPKMDAGMEENQLIDPFPITFEVCTLAHIHYIIVLKYFVQLFYK